MRAFIGLAVALIGVAHTARAQQPGDRCGARSECREGLRCVSSVCVDEASFKARPPPAATTTINETFRGFVGGVLGGALPLVWGNGGVDVQLALRAGFINKNVQFQLEVSPVTTVIAGTSPAAFSMLEATATAAYLIPMSDMVSWILRIGGGGGGVFSLGGGATNVSNGFPTGFAEFRADVVGVLIRPNDHLVLEFNVPSFRFMSLPALFSFNNIMVMWVTNVGIGYVF